MKPNLDAYILSLNCSHLHAYVMMHNAVYKQNAIEEWTKSCIFPSLYLQITKNYRSITLTTIAASQLYSTWNWKNS